MQQNENESVKDYLQMLYSDGREISKNGLMEMTHKEVKDAIKISLPLTDEEIDKITACFGIDFVKGKILHCYRNDNNDPVTADITKNIMKLIESLRV